jgi:hypothetical protein
VPPLQAGGGRWRQSGTVDVLRDVLARRARASNQNLGAAGGSPRALVRLFEDRCESTPDNGLQAACGEPYPRRSGGASVFRKLVAAMSALMVTVLVSSSDTVSSPAAESRRGCCSHHGGVSGGCCGSGTLRCNDGSCSPSCGC